MSIAGSLPLALSAFVLSFVIAELIRRYGARLGLVQAPNFRSSHIKPTVSGGGLGIAVAGTVLCLVIGYTGPASFQVAVAVSAIGATIGFLDDRFDLSSILRIVCHFGLVSALLLSSGTVDFASGLQAGLVIPVLTFGVLLFAGVWWVNLFNFMDGIDGIAASQAILILMGGCLVWWTAEPAAIAQPVFAMALIAILASAGFLLRNWPPAHIFMGDAGSNGLALIIFAIAALNIAEGGVPYQSWLILPSVFVTDATVTLLRRIVRLEKPWDAHRRHGYQQLARRWGHRTVTLAYGALTLFGAIPLAWLAQSASVWSWALVAAVYGVWAGLALWAGAGASTETVPA